MKICKALRDKALRVFFIVTWQARKESRRHNKSPTAVMPEKPAFSLVKILREAVYMSKRDRMLQDLCKSLGKNYIIATIDLERVIYRDFGNGFNVEISGVHTSKENKRATLYLWHGNSAPACLIVKTISDVPRGSIGDVAEELCRCSEELIRSGKGDRESLFQMLHPEMCGRNATARS
jgi:hypothetical protein|nr:MAG TPA: hypothetical protein [Caudoviricetes sp.]